MSATSILLKTFPPDEAASNRLLRALWAELRAEFGQLVWQNTPRRHGHLRKIYFGYADLALSTKIHIGVTYRKRGVIERIVFEDVVDKANLPTARFERCVRLAENATETNIPISAKLLLPYDLRFQSVEGHGPFSLLHHTDETTYLCLRVCAFDETDAAHQFALHTMPILDVLSSFTNLFLTLGEITALPPSPSVFQRVVSSPSLDWLDGYPVTDGLVAVPEHCLTLVNDIVRDDLDVQKQHIIDACHHFHAARALEEQSLTFLAPPSVHAELALVLYMSCLEVLSLINAPCPRTCPTCSQPKHRISARVAEFMEQHNGPAAAQVIKELYDTRSKYLHAGRLLSSRSFTVSTIPQLDSFSKNGIRSPVPLAPLLNLREYTSFCIRAVTHALASTQQSHEVDA